MNQPSETNQPAEQIHPTGSASKETGGDFNPTELDETLKDWAACYQLDKEGKLNEFIGNYVVIYQGKVVAHGKDSEKLRRKMAKKFSVPAERLVLYVVEPAENLLPDWYRFKMALRESVRFLLRFGVLTLLLAILLTFLMNISSHRVIHYWAQPKEIIFPNAGPYVLSVVEESNGWYRVKNLLGSPSNPQTYLVVGRGEEGTQDGYYFAFSFDPGADDLEAYIKRSEVEWTTDGIDLIEPSGNRIFIHQKRFARGR